MSSESFSKDREAPWPMLFFRDASHLYTPELVAKCGGKITDVWLFDMRTCVRCCEARPSFEMEYFASEPYEFPEDDDEREKLEELLIATNVCSGQEPFQYFLIQGDLRRLTIDSTEFPTIWDGKTTPAVISLDAPDEDAWQQYLDDEDGAVRPAHKKFMADTREYIQGNSPY